MSHPDCPDCDMARIWCDADALFCVPLHAGKTLGHGGALANVPVVF
ncbi:hypothetical protein [Tateyamaria omphalii]|nr:hypothetical protein [Tateyamaria omphalii]